MAEASCIVVGAGIVGAACAYELASAGLDVEVLESAFSGGGTTAAGMGHIVVMDDSEAQFALTSLGARLWTGLADELPERVEDTATGTLWVAAGGEELDAARRRCAWYLERGIAAEILDANQIAQAEPNLREGLAGGLFIAGDRVLYPPAATRWLLDQAVRLGARVHAGVPVEEITRRGVRTAEGWKQADVVVNAAGVNAAALTPGLPIEPRKGHLIITSRYPGFCRHQLVELGYLTSAHGHSAESVAFNLQPRATGQVLLGSSREFAGLDASINRRLVSRMIRRALEYVPGIEALSAVRIWTGFRPCTPDNLPLIGRWSPVERLFVAAGHEGLGITTSLATARLLADQILGRAPAIDPAPFSPSRVLEGAVDG